MEEIWKDIKGVKLKGYKISNLGRVKSPDYYVEVGGKFVLYKQGKILNKLKKQKNRLFICWNNKSIYYYGS